MQILQQNVAWYLRIYHDVRGRYIARQYHSYLVDSYTLICMIYASCDLRPEVINPLNVHSQSTRPNYFSMFHQSPFSSPFPMRCACTFVRMDAISVFQILFRTSRHSLARFTRFRTRRCHDGYSTHSMAQARLHPRYCFWCQLLSRTMMRFCSPSPKLWANSFLRWEAQAMLPSSYLGEPN